MTRRRLRKRSCALSASFLLAACAGGAPVRIVVDADTLIVNGPRSVLVGVRATDSQGRKVHLPALKYASSSSAVHASADGHVTCVRSGDGVVAVLGRSIATQVVVLCRPIASFAPSASWAQLWIGEPPVAPVVRAFDSTGTPVELLSGTAHIRDQSIARIAEGRVVALASGRTQLDLDFDGVTEQVPIQVAKRLVGDSVVLVGGELRSWSVPPGYYELQLDLPHRDELQRGLELAAYHANCARAPIGRSQHYFCILKDHASVVVRNARSVGPGSERSGELTVLQLP